MVRRQRLVGNFGQRIVAGQAEDHPHTVVLVFGRQRLRGDLRWMLDVERATVIRLQVIIAQPILLQHHAVPLASFFENWMDGSQRFPAPADGVHAVLVDLVDGPGPAAKWHVGVVGVPDTVFDSHLVADLELGDDRFGSSFWHGTSSVQVMAAESARLTRSP